MSHPPAPGAVPVPGSVPTPPAPSAPASSDNKIRFFGSQVGGEAVINYGYTDMPLKLLVWDIRNFFVYIWFLPWIVWPLTPTDSGDFDELAFNRANVWCLFVHGILIVLQLLFILALPFSLLFPLWVDALAIALFFTLNWALCMLLNGKTKTLLSDPKYATDEDHPNEQWIFLNGVAAGEVWLTSNINRLALTFRRPVIGIHNRTSGIIFDVVECLIQRNFGYATGDVREAYKVVKDKLYNPQYSKVVFILHSQGGIEGGLVLDWLLQEMPQDLLAKLEVYTFGNAANHFNNPHLHVKAQESQREHCAAALAMRHHGESAMPMRDSPVEYKVSASPVARRGDLSMTSHHDDDDHKNTAAATTHPAHPIPTTADRVIAHVEHYAHTTDFVALWGVLHFATSQLANKQLPRFIGRVFARTSSRGGHQFCQHYLDGMFPLEKNPRWEQGGDGEVGVEEFLGCADSNEFMDSIVEDGTSDAATPDAVAAATAGTGNAPASTAAEAPSRPTVTTTSPNDINGAAQQPQPQPSTQPFADMREDIATSLALLLPDPAAILEAASLPFSSDKDADAEGVQFHDGSRTASDAINRKLRGGTPVRVKDLSRLWLYRNGRNPPDVHREGGVGGGVIRGKTL